VHVAHQSPSEVTVEVDERDISDFNDQWPASNLHGLEGVSFGFDARNGDLIDIDYVNGDADQWDGPALAALVDDAQMHAGLASHHSLNGRHAGNRGHGQGSFAEGFAAGGTDRSAGRTRQLCVSERGVKPPVTKREDGTDYYHGYKSAAEGAASEPSAYLAYRAKHRGMSGMVANARGRRIRSEHYRPTLARSREEKKALFYERASRAMTLPSDWSEQWDREYDEEQRNIAAMRPNGSAYDAAMEKSGAAIRAFTAVQADYRAQRIGDDEYMAGRRIYEAAMREYDEAYAQAESGLEPNPHLSLDGNFSFGIGDKDHGHMEANARQNITKVISAFRSGRPHREDTCHTDGQTVWSYGLPIASRIGGQVVVLDKIESPSRTTSGQIRAVMAEFPEARAVSSVRGVEGYGAIERSAHRQNARGIYHESSASANDYAVHVHGTSGQFYVDRVGRGGTHTTIGPTRGYPTKQAALEAIRDDAHVQGYTSGIIFEQRGDELVQVGHVSRSHDAAGQSAEWAGSGHEPNWREMLDLAGVERRLGADFVAKVLTYKNPAIWCKTRAHGAWMANEPDYYEAYTSLARMIDDGDLDDLLAAAH